MANAPNFAGILDRPSSEAERPKPLPQGSYFCVVSGLPRFDKSAKKQTPFVEFMLKVQSAGEDVDVDALAEMGGIADKQIKATYYLTDDAEYRLKEFLNDLDIPLEEDGTALTHRQRIEQAPGRQVIATIKHTASDDGESVYANLGGTAKVE